MYTKYQEPVNCKRSCVTAQHNLVDAHILISLIWKLWIFLQLCSWNLSGIYILLVYSCFITAEPEEYFFLLFCASCRRGPKTARKKSILPNKCGAKLLRNVHILQIGLLKIRLSISTFIIILVTLQLFTL